jgi:hypothetical protein
MLERSFDADFINAVVNHPEVRPYIGDGPDVLDLSDAIEQQQNWFLMGEHGGFALIWSAPGVYEVHTFILPEGRGAWGAKARNEGIDFARDHGAAMLWTKVPPKAPHVARFARQGGMKPTEDVIQMSGTPYQTFKMELI